MERELVACNDIDGLM